MKKAEQDLRLKLFNTLLTSPHRDLDKLHPIHLEVREQDPLFYRRLASWYWDKGEIRDQKEIFIVGLILSDFENDTDIGLALLRKLPPYEVCRVLDFIKGWKSFRVGKTEWKYFIPKRTKERLEKSDIKPEVLNHGLFLNAPRSMRTEIKRYLQEREAEDKKLDSVIISARKHLKRMYAVFHIAPSERAQAILFNDKPPQDSKLFTLKLIAKEQRPAKQARLLMEYRIPYRIASTVIKTISPTVLVALINVMSSQELINNMASLKRRGAFDNPEVKALITEKLEKAKKDKRVSAYKAKEAIKVAGVSKDVEEKLDEITEAQVKAKGKIKRPTALFVDKCITENTWLFTEEGIIQIQELIPKHFKHYSEIKLDCELASRTGKAEADRLYSNGLKEVFEVTTKKGYSLTATMNHRILCLDVDSLALNWKEVNELSVDDIIPVHRKMISLGNKEFSLDWFQPKEPYQPNEFVPMYPRETSPELGKFLGYLVSEGRLRPKPRIVEIANYAEEILKDFEKLTVQLFGLHAKRTKTIGRGDNKKRVNSTIQCSALVEFFRKIGFGYERSRDRKVPWVILRSSKETQKGFLQALFEGDGGLNHRNTKTIYLTSTSKKLVKVVQLLLLRFGIISRISFSGSHSPNNPNLIRRSWRLGISGADAEKFAGEIGFISNRKKMDLDYVIKRHPSKTWETRLDNVPGIGKFLSKNLSKKDIRKIRKEFPTNNYFDNSENVGCPYWALVKATSLVNLNCFDGIREILKEQYFFDRISKIESKGLQFTFDLRVPNQDAFVASGIISHNSGSMETAIEVGKRIAAMLSAICESDLWVYAFDTMAYYIPHPPSIQATLKDWEKAFKGIRGVGGTSFGVALEQMRRDERYVEQIIIVTDGGENEPPFFIPTLKTYRQQLKADPNICFVKVPGQEPSDHVEQGLKEKGTLVDAFTFTGDYYALPNLLPLVSKPSKLELLEEIMNWPLPERLVA